MFGKIFDSVVNTVDEFIEDPVGKVIDTATQPIRDGLEVFEGLTEGELRVAASARLDTDVVAGMALGELIEWAGDE